MRLGWGWWWWPKTGCSSEEGDDGKRGGDERATLDR